MSSAIVDASPIIALAAADRLGLLPQLFDEIIVPAEVHREVTSASPSLPGVRELSAASWFRVERPAHGKSIPPAVLGLGPGETNVILLALTRDTSVAVIDERLGRRVARHLGIPLIGTAGLLAAAVRTELLSRDDALDSMARMQASGIRFGPRVLEWLWKEIG